MDQKEELERKIEQIESQLHLAELESYAWNKGKYKNHSNAQMSKIYVESLRKEIKLLRAQLQDS